MGRGGGSGAAQAAAAGQPYNEWSHGAQQGSGYESLAGSGTPFTQLTDPISALAARLGQLRGKQMEAANPSRGPGFHRQMEKEMGPLKELYELQLQKMMREEGQAAHTAPRAHSGGGSSIGGGRGLGGGGGRGGFGGLGGGGGGFSGFRRDEPRMETALMDPYREMRESSIKAAQEYLKNPRPILSMKG